MTSFSGARLVIGCVTIAIKNGLLGVITKK
jgi:hypothetical protein